MSNLGQKISILLEQKRMTQKELSFKTGITEVTISRYINGKREPTAILVKKIADVLNVPVDFLLGSEKSDVDLIPVYASVSAGVPLLTNEEIVDYEEIPMSWKNQGDFFGLKIKGKSMEPRFLEGDTLIVRKQCNIDSGDLAIVLIDGEEATFKQVLKSENGITLVGLNTAVYLPKFYSNEQIENLPVQIIGKVVGLRAEF